MKKFIKSVLGVTLLEILLVLVIASLILVMSVRYYQTAAQSSKVNSALEILTGYMASVESYIAAGNAVSVGMSCTTAAACTALSTFVPTGGPSNSPWGTGPVTITGQAGSYLVTYKSVPAADCAKFSALATQSASVTVSTACAASGVGDFVLTVVP